MPELPPMPAPPALETSAPGVPAPGARTVARSVSDAGSSDAGAGSMGGSSSSSSGASTPLRHLLLLSESTLNEAGAEKEEQFTTPRSMAVSMASTPGKGGACGCAWEWRCEDAADDPRNFHVDEYLLPPPSPPPKFEVVC